MITGLDTIWVPVQDMPTMRDFYEGVLGLQANFVDEMWVAYSVGGLQVGLHKWTGAAKQVPGWVPCFTVADLAGARERLLGAGCECSPPHETPRGLLFQSEDPEGNAFQVFQVGSALADFV